MVLLHLIIIKKEYVYLSKVFIDLLKPSWSYIRTNTIDISRTVVIENAIYVCTIIVK